MTDKCMAGIGSGMTIDTQKLRELLENAGAPTLYIRTNRHPETDGRPWGWVSEHPPGGHNSTLDLHWTRGEKSDYRAQMVVGAVNALPALLDHIDTQAAEIARLLGACRTAVLALAHSTQENRGVYESAYRVVSDAIEEASHDR